MRSVVGLPAALHQVVKYDCTMVVEIAHCNPIAFRGHWRSHIAVPGDPTILPGFEAGASFGPLNTGHGRSGHTWGMKRLQRGHSLRDS
jgi:hypothetical protein